MDMIAFGLLIVVLLTLIVGLYAGRKVNNKLENFFVAGRKLVIPLVAISLIGQAIDGNATMANTELGAAFGFWAGAALPIGLAISLFLLGKFFAGKLNEMKLLTLADFFREKYGRKVEFVASILMIIAFGLLLAGNLAVVGFLTEYFFPIDYNTAVIVIAIVTIIYVIFGGIISDIFTDLIQVGLLFLGVVLAIMFLFFEHGFGIFFSETFSSLISVSQLFDPAQGGLINIATIIALGFGNIIAVDFASRILSARSPKDAEQGCYYGAWGTLLLGIPFSIFSIYAVHFGIEAVEGVPFFVSFSAELFPILINFLLIAGVFSISLSTCDGGILSMSNVFMRNILSIKGREMSQSVLLYYARISVLPIAVSAMLFALLFPYPGIMLTVAFDVLFAGCLIPFIAAFILRDPSKRAALAAIIVGSLARLLFAVLTPTTFGLENTIFYIENSFLGAETDGIGTIVSPILSLIAFVFVTMRENDHRHDLKKDGDIISKIKEAFDFS